MSNMSYEESGIGMPGPHTMLDKKQYHEDRHRDGAEDFDTAMDEHTPIIRDTLHNSDALIRGIVNGTARPSFWNQKRNSRGGASQSTSASLSAANSATLIMPATQFSGTSAINGATHVTPIVDDVSKLISRLATEVRKFFETQHEGAIEEISKAQDIINSLEEKHGRAVDEARREREKVRILEEEIKLKEAREAGYKEGRKQGMEEGLKRGAAESKRYGGEDGREAERERQKKAIREQIENDEVYEPRLPGERHPQTHAFNVIGPPLLQTGNSTTVTTVPANLSRNISARLGDRAPPNRGHGPPNHSAFSPRDNLNINILSGFEDEPDAVMGMNAPELSMEASLGKRDDRTSAPPRTGTSSVDRDGDWSDPAQQRSWGEIIGNGQGYRAPIRQRSGSGSTNGTTSTGVPRTTGRTSITPSSSSTQARSTPLDQYGILGDGGSHSSGLISQVAEMTPIMEASSEPGHSPTQGYVQDTAIGDTSPQAETDRREGERRERRHSDAEDVARGEQERLQQQQQSQRWPAQQPPSEQHHVPLQRLTSQPSLTNHGTTPVSSVRFDAEGHHASAAPPNITIAKGKGKAMPVVWVGQGRRQGYVDYDEVIPEERTMGYSIHDQDPTMTTRNRAQCMSGILDRTDSKRVPIYASAGAILQPSYKDARLPSPPKRARMMLGGSPQNQSNGSTLGAGRSVSGKSGVRVPSPSMSQSSSKIRMDMDMDIQIVPYDEEDTGGDQNCFPTIDILDERAEHREPKSRNSRGRNPPRSNYQDEVEVIPSPNGSPRHHPFHHQGTSLLSPFNRSLSLVSPGAGGPGPSNAHVYTSRIDESLSDPIRSNEPSSFLVDQSGNPIRTPLRQSMPISAGARSSTSAMLLPPIRPNDIPRAGKTTTSQLPRPDTMHEPAPPSATVVPNTATTWGYVRDSGQSMAPFGPLSNGGLALYHANPPNTTVVPTSHFGYLGQSLAPSSSLTNGGLALYRHTLPTTPVVPNNHFGYLEQGLAPLGPLGNGGLVFYHPNPPTTAVVPNSHFEHVGLGWAPLGPLSSGGPALYRSAPPTTAAMPNSHFGHSGQSLSSSGPLSNGGVVLYQSAPSTTTAMPNTSTTWGYVRDSGQSLAPLGPLSNGGLAFSVGGSVANQMTM